MTHIIRNLLGDKDFSEIVKAGSVSLFFRFGGLALGALLTWIIAYFFDGDGLGKYVLAIIVLRFFTIIAKLGLDTASIKFLSAFASQNKWKSIFNYRHKVMRLLFLTSIITSCFMFFFSNPIANYIGTDPEYITINAFMVLPMSFFMLNYQSLRGLKRIAEFSFFFRMSQALFTIISLLIIYQFNTGKEIAVYAYAASLVIVSLLSFFVLEFWIKRKSKYSPTQLLEALPYSKLLQISIPLMFANASQLIMAWTDKLMIGSMLDAESVGVYHIAFKLSMFAAAALMAINSIVSPKLSELFANNDMRRFKKVAQQSTMIIFWTTFPLLILFFIFPKFFLGIFGNQFQIGAQVFMFLSFGRLISSMSGSVGNILQMTSHQKIYGIILFFGALLNVILNYVLIPRYGIDGAGMASMTSLIFWNICMVLVVKKKFGFYTFYIPFIKI